MHFSRGNNLTEISAGDEPKSSYKKKNNHYLLKKSLFQMAVIASFSPADLYTIWLLPKEVVAFIITSHTRIVGSDLFFY